MFVRDQGVFRDLFERRLLVLKQRMTLRHDHDPASLAKMQINTGLATAAVIGGWASNIHFRPGEFNFLRKARNSGLDAALEASGEYFSNPS